MLLGSKRRHNPSAKPLPDEMLFGSKCRHNPLLSRCLMSAAISCLVACHLCANFSHDPVLLSTDREWLGHFETLRRFSRIPKTFSSLRNVKNGGSVFSSVSQSII